MEDSVEVITGTLAHWMPPGHKFLDSQLPAMFRSNFFNHYLRSTEQVLMILDQHTMKYVYVSDNFHAMTGHRPERLYARGTDYTMNFFHPDDAKKLSGISKVVHDT